jgi:hypothetical protein
MTNDNNPKGIKPSTEDKQRLDILSKEINERLEEFGSIIFKTLRTKTPNNLSEVSFERSKKGYRAKVAEENGYTGPIVYYCDPPGICTTDLQDCL